MYCSITKYPEYYTGAQTLAIAVKRVIDIVQTLQLNYATCQSFAAILP